MQMFTILLGFLCLSYLQNYALSNPSKANSLVMSLMVIFDLLL